MVATFDVEKGAVVDKVADIVVVVVVVVASDVNSVEVDAFADVDVVVVVASELEYEELVLVESYVLVVQVEDIAIHLDSFELVVEFVHF